ncbi:MAG: hypothetical protein GWM90_06250, partial [Gemmatimonadetes bacterium]|nr:hypothetical protein [Gemmatimonadota bacterium]NIQ53373.1 hypothetical protein [Gemmatimonadota bacterium]NIU73516.1 hypothetical protein [Gammaproteobacteria bacterium]NIX43725.1 hypothetical protein [Gemmatimonadota bacterium]NIY07918.1 hypothetical protein [Gemmatimonadota bacterium]
MTHRPTVRLVASDRTLFDRAAATLDAADYRIADDPPRAEAPTLIVRHWKDPSRLDETSVP